MSLTSNDITSVVTVFRENVDANDICISLFGDPELRQLVEDAKKEERTQAKKQIAGTIVDIMKHSRKHKEYYINSLRDVRKKEKALKRNIKEVELAEKYASETLNFVPLLCVLGLRSKIGLSHSEVEQLQEIPEGWTPKETSGAENHS